ncbi:polysaccharide biosynthesis protein [Pseudotenacibaculum haliotis]|uniref:Polysaccharide biosynthesis protein n=1 Tax=Pseudotenacibaculum haliotis TaxID=1862138 RepID=A0ABW5LU33_9FLAO
MLDNLFKYQQKQKESTHVKWDVFNKKYLDKTILITGGAGTIGAEIVKSLSLSQVKRVIVFDFSEFSIFKLKNELNQDELIPEIIYKIGDIKDSNRIRELLIEYSPDVIIHTAAYKHLDLMEENAIEAYKNNFLGTKNVFLEALKNNIKEFIFVSTDKAVEPLSIMGLTKKMAEIYLRYSKNDSIQFKIIRFGNVIGSLGSIIPLVKKLIKHDKTITVRDKNTQRFFIYPETVAKTLLNTLTLNSKNTTYLIKMGDPIFIKDIVKAIISEEGKKNQFVEENLLKGEKINESLIENYESKNLVDGYNCYEVIDMSDIKDQPYLEIFNCFTSIESKDYLTQKDYLSKIAKSIKYTTFAKN